MNNKKRMYSFLPISRSEYNATWNATKRTNTKAQDFCNSKLQSYAENMLFINQNIQILRNYLKSFPFVYRNNKIICRLQADMCRRN